ncbi:MAG: AAA family ATPase [Victivallales bacterium]|nr:AAA family ATPase [Victivallales bacterium]
MSVISDNIDEICKLIEDKVQIGFGITSQQAVVLEQKITNLEKVLASSNVFPSNWKSAHSIGKGNLASVMWIVFLPPGQTTQDGIYVSFCFGKTGNGLVVGCAISDTSKSKYPYVPTIERKTPQIDVNGTRPGTHYNNGYVNPLEVFAGKVDENILLNHIRESVEKCEQYLKLKPEMPPNITKSIFAEERYVIWKKFLDKWTEDAIRELTLSNYTSFGSPHDSFCNWLEIHTESLGSIWGGSSYKFGIFERNPDKAGLNDLTHSSDDKYSWYKKYGNSSQDVFLFIKNIIIKIIEAIHSNKIADIDDIDLGQTVKWKIAFLYQSIDTPSILPIYNKEMLVNLSGLPKGTPTSIMQKKLMDEKPDNIDLFDYCDELLQKLSENINDEDTDNIEETTKWKAINSQLTIKKGTQSLSAVLDSDSILKRLAASLRTKPFAILAGHSGTGKSQLVRRLAYMTCNNELLIKEGEDKTAPGNYCMVQVKPNWHDSTDLLGYYSEMGRRHFVNTPFVQFICKAYAYPETPFFVCLDEMNLAPVEQYFAEYLSAIESMEQKDDIWITDPLVEVDKTGDKNADGKEKVDLEIVDQIMKGAASTEAAEWIQLHGLTIPKNLFVIGTVNMDETTCQFSRKVLDRAMTLLMNEVNFSDMAKSQKPSEEILLDDDGLKFFLEGNVRGTVGTIESDLLNGINEPLANTAFMVAYRFANEYALYEAALAKLEEINLENLENDEEKIKFAQKALDHVVLMKLLPRIHEERTTVQRIFKGYTKGEQKVLGLKDKLPKDGLSAKMMDAILARNDEYLTFWP